MANIKQQSGEAVQSALTHCWRISRTIISGGLAMLGKRWRKIKKKS
jgi:hypothetical protein